MEKRYCRVGFRNVEQIHLTTCRMRLIASDAESPFNLFY